MFKIVWAICTELKDIKFKTKRKKNKHFKWLPLVDINRKGIIDENEEERESL